MLCIRGDYLLLLYLHALYLVQLNSGNPLIYLLLFLCTRAEVMVQPNGGSASVSFKVRTKAVGEFSVRVTARSDAGFSDAVLKYLRVEAEGTHAHTHTHTDTRTYTHTSLAGLWL